MRKSIFAWSAVAVAAIATLSCQKEANFVAPDHEEGVTIHVLADNMVTKTAAVDAVTPSIQWSEGDKIKIYEIVDDVVGANAESDEAVINAGKASFTATLSGSAQGASFKYSAVYPASAVDKGNSFYRIKMPKDQTLKGNNFSEDSDLLFSTVLDHGSSRVANNESVQFSFRRLGTVVRLQLVGITAGEKIKKVTLTAPVNMAGRVKYNPITGTISDAFYDSTTNSNVITLTVSDELVATGDDVVWFRVIAERDWGKENDKIGVEVETDKANYYRNGQDAQHALIDSPKIKFIDGGLTKFGFNLASYRVEKPSPTVYTKVTDASEIADGGQYLVTSFKDPKTFAMGSYTEANNPYYSAVEVTEKEGSIAISAEPVTIITLEDAGNGTFYIRVPGEQNDQHLTWTAGNSILRADKGTADGFKWTVTPTSISNVGTPARLLQYNSGSPRFACYQTTQTAIQLYVNPATITPVVKNTITLTGVDNEKKIHLDAVSGVAAYFTVTADANWTTNVNIVNGDFSIDPESGQAGDTEIEVSADEDNTGAERQMGTITITCGNATETVYVIQNAGSAAPAKGTQENPYTVAEALDVISGLGENGITEAKFYVSGIVSQIGNLNSAGTSLTYFISDNGATTSQLQVYNGKYVNGANFTSAELIATGDQVVVYGKLQDYQSTPEISSSNIYSLKGLTTALELAQPTLSYNEANKQITVTWTAATGSNSEISYEITCGTQSYGPVTAAGSHTFTMAQYGSYDVTVKATTADAAAAIAKATAILTDPGTDNGDGQTPETAFNMAGVKAYIESLNGSASAKVYVKGKISKIESAYTADYGNGTFWISDDGSSKEFEAYRALYLGNVKWEEGDTQIAVGDEVILYGNVTKYNNTIYETSSGNAYLYSLNGVKYPMISVSDISGVAATGVTNATSTVTFVDNEGWTASVTPDGTVVTAASISGSTITYTVGANTGGARNGKITVSLTKDARTISAEISVSQMPGTTGGTDILNRALTGVTGTSYSEWSGKMSNSSAVYAGQSAGGNESIQLRSKNNNSGIVTTASGGKIAKIIVTWNSNTAGGRTLNIYGKNSAYTAATDLYDANKQGTLLGTIVMGTSTELTVSGDYEFIGLRSNSDAMFIEQIQIIWN